MIHFNMFAPLPIVKDAHVCTSMTLVALVNLGCSWVDWYHSEDVWPEIVRVRPMGCARWDAL